MRIFGITALVIGLLALTLTTVFAAGQGKGGRKCQQQAACVTSNTTVVTVEGTVRDLVQPEAGKQAGPVQFILAAGDETMTVRLGPPQALAAMQLALANGDTVKLTGWKVTRDASTWIVARELTLKDKTYTLRAEDGTPVWRGQGGCSRGDGQSRGQCSGGQCRR